MKKLIPVLFIFLFSSCKFEQVVIVEKYDPIDYYVSRFYPIQDTLSCAVEVRKLQDYKLFYVKDEDCYIVSEYSVGDTIYIKRKLTNIFCTLAK